MGAEEQQQAEGRGRPELNAKSKSNAMTMAQFISWKTHKDAAASAIKAEASRKRAEDIAAGTVQMNGRELFLHEPWVLYGTIKKKQIEHGIKGEILLDEHAQTYLD
ncbi:hypothetical protein RJ639_020443 [Escallonia herrerae]|uniref:ZC3H15/TMA46 family C-terminal domain-containing protein n=1 Tax=Escallonia herrerae TaxID=1293975 RepID=A0AA88V404_9ASTE|nr:hypothetical protein RJ639_020443 [Escallonia herrerae]